MRMDIGPAMGMEKTNPTHSPTSIMVKSPVNMIVLCQWVKKMCPYKILPKEWYRQEPDCSFVIFMKRTARFFEQCNIVY